jgi:ribA/ribD-fused uncharacterized protein
MTGKLSLDTSKQVFFYEQEFYVLSNFSAFGVSHKRNYFQTAEAAYHFLKFPEFHDIQVEIQYAPSAHLAYKIAEKNKDKVRVDWVRIRADVMLEILFCKVDQHEYVKRKLLETGNRELIENSWRDDYWGWGPNRDGRNMLGTLWMQVRSSIRARIPKS